MVDRSDLAKADFLNRQYQDYRRALGVLERNPTMVSFTLRDDTAADDPESVGTTAVVSAEGIETPPQMMAAIKAQVEARIEAIDERLTGMGVSASAAPQAPQEARGAPPPPKPPSPAPQPKTPASEPPKPAAKPASTHRGRR